MESAKEEVQLVHFNQGGKSWLQSKQSLTIIGNHWQSLAIISNHWVVFFNINQNDCQWLSMIVKDCFDCLLIANDCQWLRVTIHDFAWESLTIIGNHWQSLAIISNHWQSTGNQSNPGNQKFSFSPLCNPYFCHMVAIMTLFWTHPKSNIYLYWLNLNFKILKTIRIKDRKISLFCYEKNRWTILSKL